MIRSFAHQIAVMYLGNIVEVIPGEDVAEKSLHPYTQALLGAQFSIHMDQNKKIESIESEAPSPLDVPHGCSDFSATSSPGITSTIFPRYITAI